MKIATTLIAMLFAASAVADPAATTDRLAARDSSVVSEDPTFLRFEFEDAKAGAESGIVIDRYDLGVMYETGRGVPQDFVEAYAWYNLASESRFRKAAEARDWLAKRMTPDQLAEAKMLASDYVK